MDQGMDHVAITCFKVQGPCRLTWNRSKNMFQKALDTTKQDKLESPHGTAKATRDRLIATLLVKQIRRVPASALQQYGG